MRCELWCRWERAARLIRSVSLSCDRDPTWAPCGPRAIETGSLHDAGKRWDDLTWQGSGPPSSSLTEPNREIGTCTQPIPGNEIALFDTQACPRGTRAADTKTRSNGLPRALGSRTGHGDAGGTGSGHVCSQTGLNYRSVITDLLPELVHKTKEQNEKYRLRRKTNREDLLKGVRAS